MWNKALDVIYNLFTSEESGIKVVGDNWFARYSNAFKDREGEFFPVEAIDSYIERVDTGVVPAPELWIWHTPVVVGKAHTIARIGMFAVAAGTFADTPQGQAAKAYLQRHKAKLSHGFVFDKDTYKDSAYWDYNTFEISILPFERGVEANAYTNFEVKDMAISKEKEKFFVEMFGEDTAKELIANTNKASKALEEAGVQFKDWTKAADMKPKAEGDEDEDEDEEAPVDETEGQPAPDDEEEDKKKKARDAGWKTVVTDMMGDMSELAEGQLALVSQVKQMNQLFEQFKADSGKQIAALKAENKALRAELALTPKGTRASESDDTVTDDEDDEEETLKGKLEKKATGAKDDFWSFAKDKGKK